MTAWREPVLSDRPHVLADWVERQALAAADASASFEDLVGLLRRGGSSDAVTNRKTGDRGSELAQEAAQAAWAELDTRVKACNGAYPFTVGSQTLTVRDKPSRLSPYVFLLLMTFHGVKTGPHRFNAASHFEQLATKAAEEYLGGPANGARSYHFGFPRRIGPSGFGDALQELCKQLREGAGPSRTPATRKAKDAKLDVVAWRPFPDGGSGKLVAFGQCAAGDNFDTKATELVTRRFMRLYMTTPLLLEPLRLFFVPRSLDEEEWLETVLADVILFDRCRMTAVLQAAVRGPLQKRNNWYCKYMLGTPVAA